MRHEIFNEPDYESVLEDTWRWIQEQLPDSARAETS
jgi:alpha-beta hydrolase superfamily lysophospholipase